MRKVRMNVSGRVQGVGFRFTTKMLADQLGVHGAVWNEADGSVSIEASAPDEVMERFIAKVKASPSPSGRVTDFSLTENAAIKERSSFDVTY